MPQEGKETKPSDVWKGVSRVDYNRYRFHVNPAGNVHDFKAWRIENPEIVLPPIAKNLPPEDLGHEPGQDQQFLGSFLPPPARLAQKFKSAELKALEAGLNASHGHPSFALYIKQNGGVWYVATVTNPTHDAIGSEFGGGEFEVRLITPNGFEDPTQSFSLKIHPGRFPPQIFFPPRQDIGRPLHAGDGAQQFTARDLEEGIRKAKQEAAVEAEIESLRARLRAGETAGQPPRQSDLELLTKFLELQKQLAPTPPITAAPVDPAQAMTNTLTGIAAVATAGLGLFDKFKGMVKPAEEKSSLSGRLMEKALDTIPDLMAMKRAELEAEKEKAGNPAGRPAETEEKLTEESMQSMYMNLAMEIAKQQAAEFNSSADPAQRTDTCGPMAIYILEQGGLPWNMLRTTLRNSPEADLIKMIAEKMPSLVDSDWKRDWLVNVITAVKKPAIIPGYKSAK